MVKMRRNQPCPCGSGRKYKHCCWHHDRAVRVQTAAAESSEGHLLVETEFDQLSNSIVSLVDEGRLDEAGTACGQLSTRDPEVHDWLVHKAMVCEARSETELAIEYCERTIVWMDAHPADFDPKSRDSFAKTSSVFEARSEAPAERASSMVRWLVGRFVGDPLRAIMARCN